MSTAQLHWFPQNTLFLMLFLKEAPSYLLILQACSWVAFMSKQGDV